MELILGIIDVYLPLLVVFVDMQTLLLLGSIPHVITPFVTIFAKIGRYPSGFF